MPTLKQVYEKLEKLTKTRFFGRILIIKHGMGMISNVRRIIC